MWKKIEKWEEYEASDSGEIRNILTKKVLSQRKNNRGYHLLDLYKTVEGERVRKTVLVHKIIALTFIEIPEDLKNVYRIQVNHKDGNKSNNNVTNLEWCDQSFNMKEAYKLGLRKYVPYEVTDEYRKKMSDIGKRPSAGKQVEMISMETNEIIAIYDNAVQAVKMNPEKNFDAGGIRDAANNRRGIKSHKGFYWRFTGIITNGSRSRESKKRR